MALDNEQQLAVLIIAGICGLAIYRLILWVIEAPETPDPWGKEAEDAVHSDEAVPLCHHCLTPQAHNGWFCPECGATVGPYSNYLPFVYIFSQGEVLRAGVTERLRRSPVITVGFILLSLGLFTLAAPIYWFFLFSNLRRRNGTQTEPPLVVQG